MIVPRQGLPLINDASQSRGDLFVIFDFEKEDAQAADEEEEIIALDQDIVIESQEDWEKRFGQVRKREKEAMKRKKDRFLKKVLLNMKIEMERERRRRREREDQESSKREEERD